MLPQHSLSDEQTDPDRVWQQRFPPTLSTDWQMPGPQHILNLAVGLHSVPNFLHFFAFAVSASSRWRSSSSDAANPPAARPSQRRVQISNREPSRSEDHGASWSRDDMGLPLAQIADIGPAGESFYALLAGGWFWSRLV
jgi:hypothetical protein